MPWHPGSSSHGGSVGLAYRPATSEHTESEQRERREDACAHPARVGAGHGQGAALARQAAVTCTASGTGGRTVATAEDADLDRDRHIGTARLSDELQRDLACGVGGNGEGDRRRPVRDGEVGGRPGLPIKVELTQAELSVNDTNKLWHTTSRAGRTHPAPQTTP